MTTVNNYSTRSDLAVAGNAASDLDAADLSESRREGRFVFVASDMSDFVVADPAQAMFISSASDSTGASGAWRRMPASSLFDIRWCGALADSTGLLGTMEDRVHNTDNTIAIRRAIALADILEMDVLIPEADDGDKFFSIQSYLRFGRTTRLCVQGALVNGYAVTANQKSNIFRPGNLHPAFLDRGGEKTITVYSCGSPGLGDTKVICSSPADVANFEIGDQLLVVSDASAALGTYQSSLYIHPAYVTSIDVVAGAVNFDAPLSFGGFACSLVALKMLAGRSVGMDTGDAEAELFFWSGRIYGPGRLESEYNSLWSDSALVDAEITGVTTWARRSPAYGNLIARSRLHDFTAYFSEVPCEFSQGSHNSQFFDCALYYRGTRFAGTTGGGNFGGDHSRNIESYNLKIDFTGCPTPSATPCLGISLAQNCSVHDIDLNVGVRDTNQALAFIGSGQSPSVDFVMRGNSIHDVRVTGVSCGYFAWIDGSLSNYFENNSIRDFKVSGVTLTGSNGYSVYVYRCNKTNSIERFDTGGQGALRIDSLGRQRVNDATFAQPPILPEAMWSSHDVQNIRWSASPLRQAFHTRQAAAATACPENLSTSIINKSLAAATVVGDVIEVEMVATPAGGGGASDHFYYFRNDTDAVDVAIPSSHGVITQASGSTAQMRSRFKLTVVRIASGTVYCRYQIEFQEHGTTAQNVRYGSVNLSAGKDYSVRAEWRSNAVGRTGTVHEYCSRINNPIERREG